MSNVPNLPQLPPEVSGACLIAATILCVWTDARREPGKRTTLEPDDWARDVVRVAEKLAIEIR